MIVVRIGQLAGQLGVHRNTIRNWINSGRLPARLLSGKRYLISEEDFAGLCREFHLERSSLKLKYVPGQPVMSREVAAREENVRHLAERSERLRPWPRLGDVCLTCGGCAGVCPLSGVDGLDPRKIVRMAVLGLEEELIASPWPWKCTLCGLCEEACPMGVEIPALMMRIRGLRERSRVPGSLEKGLQLHLARGNTMGIPDGDFSAFMEATATELAREGVPVDGVPLDRKGARLLVLVNAKIPFAEPKLLKSLWKVLAVSGETWTVPSRHWEAANWGLLTGDEEASRILTERVVENLRRLETERLLLPQCGHAAYAIRYGLQRWFPEEMESFRLVTIVDVLREALSLGRLRVDPSRHPQLTTYHDPCNYGRKARRAFGQDYCEEGRWIMRQCAPRCVEMVPGRERSYCCGAGGGAWATPFREERVFHGRFKARQIEATGARLVVTPCHNCRDQLQRSLCKEFNLNVEVKDLCELVADALV